MTTVQIITLIVFAVLGSIFYFGTALAKKENTKTIFIALWLLLTGMMWLYLLFSIEANNELHKFQLKCPEYEKVENVYKLKQ